MATRPPLPLAWLALTCACGPQGSRALDRLGEALVIITLIGLVLALICVAIYVFAWTRLLIAVAHAWRRGSVREDAVSLWWRGLAVAVMHAVCLAVVTGVGEAASLDVLFAWLTAIVLAVLVVTAILAARGGTRWPLGVTSGFVAVALVGVATYYPRRPLDELPGQIAQLGAESLIACARLSTGQIACVGANWDGQRGDGSDHAIELPTLVRGIDDATAFALGESIGCALRRDHPVTCWGGKDDQPVPGDRRVPWLLPGADGATMLAVSARSVATLGPDHVLHTWPEPPPAGLQRARLLAGDHDFDGGWFCVVEETGAIACWKIGRSGPKEPLRWSDPPPTRALAVDGDAELVCALGDGGDVRCHDLYRGRPGRAVDGLGLRTIVALDDDGTFCGQDQAARLLCWRGRDPPRELPELRGAEAIAGGGGAVCGRLGDVHRCVLPEAAHRDRVDTLLNRDRLP